MSITQARAAADSSVAAYQASFPTPSKPAPKLVPVFRLRKDAEHFYTASETERDSAIATYGYTLEGTAFWAYDSGG